MYKNDSCPFIRLVFVGISDSAQYSSSMIYGCIKGLGNNSACYRKIHCETCYERYFYNDQYKVESFDIKKRKLGW